MSQGTPETDSHNPYRTEPWLPKSAVTDNGRQWWWQQMYDLLERHGLAELSWLHGGIG